MPKCDLEDVFKDSDYLRHRFQGLGVPSCVRCQAQRPPRRRGSSGEWRHDRLSREEVSDYKRKTGQVKRWQGNGGLKCGGFWLQKEALMVGEGHEMP